MADVKCELYHDNLQNHRRYNIPPCQLLIADIPYNIGSNFYASRADWYKDGDRSNGESEKAHKAAFHTDYAFTQERYQSSALDDLRMITDALK